MADEGIKFPGAEGISVIEKYPPSRRLDFEDFSSVCKTSFSKGTITDFEKISDDPIMVKSMVKVTGDFGESEYIPLFYHPKANFWDDETATPPVLATDFDEETGAFKRAWMSSRIDDEVVVMLKEGVPVAVVGFADRVPRIGEDIFKCDIGERFWWQCSEPKRYPNDYGPDGLRLELRLPCERILKYEKIIEQPGATHTISQSLDGRIVSDEIINTEMDQPGMVWCGPVLVATRWVVSTTADRTTTWLTSTKKNHNKIHYYLMPIGAKLYLMKQNSFEQSQTWGGTETFTGKDPNFRVHSFLVSAKNLFGFIVIPSFPVPELIPFCSDLSYPGAGDSFVSGINGSHLDIPCQPPQDIPPIKGNSTSLYVALYSKEKYDEAKEFVITAQAAWPTSIESVPPGFVLCHLDESNEWALARADQSDIDLKVFVRPHTKEELQTYGMWPEE